MTAKIKLELDIDPETKTWLEDTAAKHSVSIDEVIHDTLILHLRHSWSESHFVCKLHPHYMAVREPKSTKAGCTCRNLWDLRKFLDRAALTALPEPNCSY